MRGSRLAARTWAPASANHWRLQGMQRPRERHAQCAALALAWWLAALATPAVVHAQVMAASQVTFLRDCQAAWGQVLAGWTSFNGRPITCQAATGIDCDTSGMITQIKFQGGIRGGRLPSSISNLRELTVLYLRYSRLTGSVPSEVYGLTKLRIIDLSVNYFSGSISTAVSNLRNLVTLNLLQNRLYGSIPIGISRISNLQYLDLTKNNFRFSIPDVLSNLQALTSLSLADNKLFGSIPDGISNFSRLRSLSLYNSQLNGSIPAAISELRTLTMLFLSGNQLTGSIPDELYELTNLQRLYLNENKLNGTVSPAIGNLVKLVALFLQQNELEGSLPETMSALVSLANLQLAKNRLSGTIPSIIGKLAALSYLSLAYNQIIGSLPASLSKLTDMQTLDLSHNYLTGPLVKLPPLLPADLSDNYLSGVVSAPNCQRHIIAANCFAPSKACSPELQRPAAQCMAFCGISPTTAACGGRGVCYPDGPSLVPTCSCGAGSVRYGRGDCVLPPGPTVNILPPFAFLTKGTKKETMGKFMAKPMTLFHYQRGVTSGCGLGLAFRVNFTFSLMPQFGTAGSNGFALVIAAKPKVGKPAGVGYSGSGLRSIAVVFDTLPNDVGEQHVGLCINGTEECLVKEVSPFTLTDGDSYKVWVDYEPGDPGTIQVFLAGSNTKPDEPLLLGRVSLCAVLQPGVKQPAFSFGFVASTTVKPFQRLGILSSTVQTGIPKVKAVLFKDQALGLSLSEDTFAPSRGSPFSRYVSSDFELSATKKDAWRLRDFHTWDSVDFLGWPVKNQRDCNTCWAYAVVASVEAAYGIAKQQSAPQLSVEALFALMGLSDSDKCSAGGSPTQALEKLVALDASSGLTGDSDPATTYPVQSFERARFRGYVGLMMAVQNQPVVVHIQASAATFVMYDGTYKYQDPDCYTGSLNHVVLVIGYFITRNDGSQNRIAPPFWIIRNSWGEEWGDKGHMRMDIQGGDGVCGINVLPGIYPVVKIPGDPCGQSSYQGDRPQPVMNPCGRFKCGVTAESTNNCTCNIPTATVQPFVQVVNGDGFTTCAYVDVCGSYFKNPCYVGACINDGKGSYSCICPPNHVESITIYGFPTCDPVNTTATTMTVTGDNWLCSDVHPLVDLSLTDFTDQNAGIDCSQPLLKGSVLQLANTPDTPCTAFFYTLNGDTCASMSRQLNFTEADLADLNPGLDCSKPIKAGRSVCLERSDAFAFTVPECVRYGTLTQQDTCEKLLKRTSTSVPPSDGTTQGGASENPWAALYRNNPGLTCSNTIPSSAYATGSKIGVQICLSAEYWSFQLGLCNKGRAKRVAPTLTCSGAYRFYGRGAAASAAFADYNGNACAGTVGGKVICVP